MCGILGTLNFKNAVDAARIAAMRDTMPYRGPDSNGIWLSDNGFCSLAHLRLSILDPTPAGHQPRVEESGRFVISYNGEVYNYIEIRAELEQKGYKFETGTDTEVILQAYVEWGKSCLSRFNGMFAIAIFDNETQELFLARDRLGIKPVYYYHDENELIFASETKAILKGLSDLPELNVELIDDYMSFGYIPGENTLHKGIKRLMPGHYAIVKNGQLTATQWWDLEFNNFENKDGIITGLEGIQVIQVAFPSEITYMNEDASFIPLLKTSNSSAVMSDFFNLGAMPEINPILNQLNESSKIIGGKLTLENGGEIILITDSDFFDDGSIASMRIVRNDINENYTFIENIIDVALGDAELVSLRTREVILRPLIDEALGKENSSLRTRWKWINILLPSILIIAYGLIRKRTGEKRARRLKEIYG